MEEKPNKAFKRFKLVFGILVVLFACLYFAGKSGYYDKRVANNTLLTKEAIIAFEQDVAKGKAVDISDYIKVNKQDYKNIYSKIGYTISETIDTVLNDGFGWVCNILKSLFS